MVAFSCCFNFENYIDIVVTHLNFDLKDHNKCNIAVKLVKFQFIPIRICTKMPILSTLCITRTNSNEILLPDP